MKYIVLILVIGSAAFGMVQAARKYVEIILDKIAIGIARQCEIWTKNHGNGVLMQNFFFGPGHEMIKDIFEEMAENLAYKKRDYYEGSGLDWDYDWAIKRASVFIGNLQIKIKFLAVVLAPVYTVLWVLHFCEFVAGWLLGMVLNVTLTGLYLFGVYGPMLVMALINFGLTVYEKVYMVSRECRCPECKRAYKEPFYVCERCGSIHEKLTHGIHGVFGTICNGDYSKENSIIVKCRKKLPLMLGKKIHIARQCTNPSCKKKHENSSLYLRPYLHFSLQMVGGTSSGKTEFLEAIKAISGYPRFRHFATVGSNADSHSSVSSKGSCLTLYDMPGGVFESWPNYNRDQEQFKYFDGIIFMVDPTNKDADPSNILENFTQELRNLNRLGENEASDTPMAVVVSKTDLLEEEIEPDKAEKYLESKFPALINSLDAGYKKKKYFATGNSNKQAEAKAVYDWFQNKKQ
ncbi:MAG: GTPase domain-containing protein [Oscillospiraceae bacterium]|nr:GTPase domain-containing protein [Oscillospiraceae bacterium]